MSLTELHTKQTQIIQNFFTKGVQLIAEARLSPEELNQNSSSANQDVNKWFNLELRELETLHESLRPWRHVGTDELPPPLVVECYLDPSKLRPGQTVVLGDTLCSTNQEIVLERWIIECKPPTCTGSGPVATEDLPALYKRAVISMRSLYTALRLLPTWQLHHKLSKQKLISIPLKLGIKIHNGMLPINSRGRVGLSKPIEGKKSTLSQFRIQPLVMPIGTVHCGVTYRDDVGFGVEDIEKVMVQKFMELDSPRSKSSVLGGASTGADGNYLQASSNVAVGSQGTSGSAPSGPLGPKPIISFTRPFKSPEESSSLPRPIPTGSAGSATAPIAPNSVSESVSSVVSSNSRFSSSFASNRAPGPPPRSMSIEGQQRAASLNSQGSHGSYDSHNAPILDPGSGIYATQTDVSEFVRFVDETSKKGGERIKNTAADIDSALARFQRMQNSHMQLSDSMIQGNSSSQHSMKQQQQHSLAQETLRPSRKRSSGPRSRLGYYSEHPNDEAEEGDSDMLFALSDMHF